MSTWRNFFAELRRRNVYKVATAYAVVAWLVVQAASIVLPTFHAPEWVLQSLVVLVVLGFAIAIAVAWSFEMTPEGMKRTENVPAPEKLPQWSRRKFTAVFATTALIAAGLLAWQLASRRAPMNGATAGGKASDKSIAVLPFDNLSSDKENAYFAAGIQDEILTKLAAVEGLKVISRASTEKYRSHPEDVRKVASELGVATLLEGSVQKVGESAHINVQLIDASADTHMWAQVYDRQLKDVFAVEGEVAGQVASALQGKLLPVAATAKISKPPTKNAEAYDLYLRGLFAHDEWFRGAAEPDRAISFMREAVARDPNFVGARARLAIYQAQKYAGGFDNSPELLASAKAAANEAMALDRDSPEALSAQGIIAMRIDKDYRTAITYFEKARAREPSADREWFLLGIAHAHLNEWPQAIEACERAVSLNPRSGHYLDALSFDYGVLRRRKLALETIARAHTLEPENWTISARYALFLLIDGQLDAAAEILRTIPAHIDKTFDSDAGLYRWRLAMLQRDFNAAVARANAMEESDLPRYAGEKELLLGRAQQALGLRDQSMQSLQQGCDKVRAAMGRNTDDSYLHQRLARLLAASGDEAGALEEINKAGWSSQPARVEPASETRGANQNPESSLLLAKAEVLNTLGHADEAIATLQQVIADPTSGLDITPALLRLDPMWDSIRNRRGFQELLTRAEQAEG